MSFYLEGRKLPDGPYFRIETACATIPAALEAAALKMTQEATAIWITDHRRNLILSIQDVRAMLQTRQKTSTP